MNALLQPFGLEIDLSLYIIIYISISLLSHLAVGGSLISFNILVPELQRNFILQNRLMRKGNMHKTLTHSIYFSLVLCFFYSGNF